MPSSDEPGLIKDLVIEGRFEGIITGKVSSALLAGNPALCPVSPFVDIDIGTTVANFRITGRIEWVFGHRSIALIQKSELRIETFDVQNVWDRADETIKSFVKNDIRMNVDKQIVKAINTKLMEDGWTTIEASELDTLPVYVKDYNPYSSDSICN